jgi:hypothetical protein
VPGAQAGNCLLPATPPARQPASQAVPASLPPHFSVSSRYPGQLAGAWKLCPAMTLQHSSTKEVRARGGNTGQGRLRQNLVVYTVPMSPVMRNARYSLPRPLAQQPQQQGMQLAASLQQHHRPSRQQA